MDETSGNTAAGYLATAADFVLVTTAVVSVVHTTLTTLIVWEVAAVAYLIGAGFALRHLTVHNLSDNRVGALDTLSWVFPLAASLAGANAAMIALVGQSVDGAGDDLTTIAIVGIIGIPLSWLLLHIGFANIYSSAYERAGADANALQFPDQPDPGAVEFGYFAVTIGATFATSDVEVRTRRMRLLVATHCVLSFFYNALVVAAAFQVLQRLAGG